MAPKTETLTLAQVAKLLNVSHETIRTYRKRGMPTRTVSGRPAFVAAEVLPWRIEDVRREERERSSPDEAQERTRKLAAEASLAELRLARERGEVVPAAEVESEMERLCLNLRSRIVTMRGKWAPALLGLSTMAEATATLDRVADDLLRSLREGADDLEDEADAEDVA